MIEITAERVAAAACEGVSGWRHSLESALSLTAEGNVLSLAVVRWDGPGDSEVVRQFRAVVVEGETEPIVLPRPDLDDGFAFEGEPYDTSEDVDGWQVCAAEANGRTTMLRLADSILFRGCGHISTAEARRFAAALVAKADAVEAAQAEQTDGAL